MNLILQKFQKIKEGFDEERKNEDGYKVMKKVIELVNYLGINFTTLNGGDLAEAQMKLAGYKFYLADYIFELERISKSLEVELKEVEAQRWDEITEAIKSEKGKVSNKEQIKNILVIETREIMNNQILYETMFHKYKMKINAIDDILTAIVQRLAELKKQIEQSKTI